MDASELAARARTIAQLCGIVQGMRTLASARRRQAQERFSGMERYATATRAVLSEALALLGVTKAIPSAPGGIRRVVVLFSEHGFVGALNDRLLDEALRFARGAQFLAVGSRGQRLCRERGVGVTNGGAMPTTLSAVQTTAERLIESLFGDIANGSVGEMHVVFAEHKPPLDWQPRGLRLFPPEVSVADDHASASTSPPFHTLDPNILAMRAIEEYAFAEVTWAVGEAFASEQAARFVAMENARHHIEEKLAELQASERQMRQEAITNEILEIASGAEGATP